MKYILIVLVILLLFGAKKLPELGRSFGQSLREFKDATKGLADDEENKTDR
ncbi:prolyl-tRNA synthetase [Geobacillus genomosp. 3]|uniref:Sec-independent protein translocase protein TatA n=1 Tax=Geobacillus genomosp. 3 TaxID=1921421 RepID=S5ZK19_GEOG3|nr:twin-arginine translocase TatA/TatE family subunit [Geobacillus genomosp. 3]AGT30658.1 prolyl-tRNA synthetase [Geobacillus genomosp. 3]